MVDKNGLLMIEPGGRTSKEPVIDEATRRMTAAWRKAQPSDYGYRGVHACGCGVTSDNRDYWVDGELTNSLAIHYLAFHRSGVPLEELEKVLALPYGEEEPTADELQRPRS